MSAGKESLSWGTPERDLPASRERADRRTAGLARRKVVYGATAVLAVSLALVARSRQLGDLYNPDEWYILGCNVAVHGTLGIGDEPTVFRPPGYPAFIALVLRTFVGAPPRLTAEYLIKTRPALYVAQAVLLASSFACAASWWSRRMRGSVALAAAFALSLNPLSLVLVGLPHYALIHLTLLVAGTWALTLAVDAVRHRDRALFATGLLWGLITLVRPVSLVLPLVFPLLLRGRPGRAIVRQILSFTLGMALVIAPWTLRNLAVRSAFVPVNAQAWTVLWGSTVKPLPISPDHFNWYLLVDDYLRIFNQVTGAQTFGAQALFRNDVRLEAAFRAEALGNIRAHPQVYVLNAARSLTATLLCTSGVLIKLFEEAQRSGARLKSEWFLPGNPQDFGRSAVAFGYVALSTALLPAALGGACLAWLRRDRFLLTPLLVFACMAFGHALTYMDLYYYYFRLPFLMLMAFYGFDGLNRFSASLPGGRRLGLGTLLAVGFSLAFVGLSAVLLARALDPHAI